MKYVKLFTIIAVICIFAFVAVWAEEQKAAAPAAAVPTAAPAKATEPAKKAEPAKKPTAPEFIGKVTAVDAVKNTFTVEKEVVLKSGKKKVMSKTFEAGKDVKIADIAKDAKVKIMYKKDGEKLVAESVKAIKEHKKKEEVKKEEPKK